MKNRLTTDGRILGVWAWDGMHARFERRRVADVGASDVHHKATREALKRGYNFKNDGLAAKGRTSSLGWKACATRAPLAGFMAPLGQLIHDTLQGHVRSKL